MSDDRAYRVWVGFDPEKQRYWARVPELGAESEGESRADAISAIEKQIEGAVERAAVSGEKAPAPSDLSLLGGSITLALAPALQRDLEFQARLARLSPEALAAQLLARGLGNEAPRRAPVVSHRPEPAEQTINERPRAERDGNDRGPPRRRDGPAAGAGGNRGRREGYRPEMENQADFLAYVRDQEKGRGGGGGGRGGNR